MERRLFLYTLTFLVIVSSLRAQLSSEDSTLFKNLKDDGVSLSRAGDFEGAEAKFFECLAIDSTSDKIYNNLGIVYRRQAR